MPKHVERERFPVPGAFGLERSKERSEENWLRRTQSNWDYLNRAGSYQDHLYIYVEEEYGYRSHVWTYPGTAQELVEDWCAGLTPWQGRFKGDFKQVDFVTSGDHRGRDYPRAMNLVLVQTGEVFPGIYELDDFDGECHIHEDDDAYLKVGFYRVRGRDNPEVEFRVLDALASIR